MRTIAPVRRTVTELTLAQSDTRLSQTLPWAPELTIVLMGEEDGLTHTAAVEEFGVAFGKPIAPEQLHQFIAARRKIEDSLSRGSEMAPKATELQQLGKGLAEVIFGGDIERLYYGMGASNIRVALAANQSKLKDVPWELMIWPGKHHAPSADRSLARVVACPRADHVVPLDIKHGIDVLVIGADVPNEASFDRPWKDIEAGLKTMFESSLGKYDLATEVRPQFVNGVDHRKLQEAVRGKKFAIVHILAHGDANGLLFRGKPRNRVINTQQLVALLGTVQPALVILSACETAKVDHIYPLAGIAEALVADAIPAVVANQMKFEIAQIGPFCLELYARLARSGNIDDAVALARTHLVRSPAEAGQASFEWGIPVLYRRPGCSQLFEIPTAAATM